MSNNRQVKRRISTAQNISKITKAMEMVAASKMKRAQDQALSARPYAQAMTDSLQTLGQFVDPSLHALFIDHQQGRPIALVLSTDKGLCGGLNTNLLKQLINWRNEHSEGAVIAVGKKAVLFSRTAGLELHAQFTALPEKVTISDILPISSLVMDGFLDQKFSRVDLIYMDFVNTLSQKVRQEQLLPIKKSLDELDGAQEKTGEFYFADYVFEPDPRAILQNLLPFYVENTIYHAFLELKASEHSARMVAMKNASENAAELVDELRLIYNKTRQQAITSELLDITTAQLALG